MKKVILSDQFIHIYNELDSFMRKELKAGDEADHSYMIHEMAKRDNRTFEIYGYELRLFARLRNAIIHNPYQKNAHPIAEPHKNILEKYEYIKNLVIHQPKALSIAVPGPKIFTATLDSSLHQIMKTMLDKAYTHVPVIENGMMIGVFSENTLFSYLSERKDIIITSDAIIRDLKEFISLEKHLNEYFEFISRDAPLLEVADIFRKGLKDLKRIAVVYITEHGKQLEKPLGMITVWDLAGAR